MKWDEVEMGMSLCTLPQTSHRKFLFSGLHAKQEESLMKKIESLKGRFLDSKRDMFPQDCTHVIAQEFSTTEKMLGALAGGRWLLSTNYILDSYKAGRWLNEEDFELPDYEGLAKYHRQVKKSKKRGLYEGWKILVLLHPPSFARKFRRILVAGGAEIALKDDASSYDFVITNRDMLDHAKAVVDSIKPLVDISYIRCTLLYRQDPDDLKKYDLRHPPNQEAGSSPSKHPANLQTLKTSAGSSLPKHSANLQTPRTSTSSSSLKHAANLQTPRTPADSSSLKHPAILQTSRTPEDSSSLKHLAKLQTSRTPANSSSLSPAKTTWRPNGRQISKIPAEENSRGKERKIKNLYGQLKQTTLKDFIKPEKSPSPKKSICDESQNVLKRFECSPPAICRVNGDLQNQDGLTSKGITAIQHSKNTFEDKTPVNASPLKKRINRPLQNKYGVKIRYKSESEHTEKSTFEDVPLLSASSGVTCADIDTHEIALRDFHVCLGERVTFSTDPNIKAKYHSPSCGCINAQSRKLKKRLELLKKLSLKDQIIPCQPVKSKYVKSNSLSVIRKRPVHDSVSKQVHHHQELVLPQSSSYTVTKRHIRKIIVQSLRARNLLNEMCSINTLSIPRDSEHFPNLRGEVLDSDIDAQQIIDAPDFQHHPCEHRELTNRELQLYICCTDDFVNEEELLAIGMETLQHQLSSYAYPPCRVLGSLLKKHVLETQFSMVHSRALRVAYMILHLHSPSNAQMRTYYLRALQHAMEPNDFGSYIPWKFVQHIIQLASHMESYEDFDQSMEQEEDLNEATRAFHLVEFITLLLTEDVRHFSYGEQVQNLLTWQMFYGTSESCHTVTPPVKQLLGLWISEQTDAPALRGHLSHLVSVVLEVLWKFSGQPLVPVDTLPASLAAIENEMQIIRKGLRSQEYMELVWSLPTPWAQAVISFMSIQKTAVSPKRISISYIGSSFKNCAQNTEQIRGRKGEMELLFTLSNCYLEVSLSRHASLVIKKCVGELLKNTKIRKVRTDGIVSLTASENYCQTSNVQNTEATKAVPQYLNLSEDKCLEDLSKLEECAVTKILSCIQLDSDVSSKFYKPSFPLKMKISKGQILKRLYL